MTLRLLALALLLSACSSSSHKTASVVDPLCTLTDAPHATKADRTALRDKAKAEIRTLKLIPNDPRSKAIFQAAFLVTTSGVELPLDLPSPLASAFTQNGTAYGLPSLDHALSELAKACEQ